MSIVLYSVFFFFNDTATTEIYTLSLHDALPIWAKRSGGMGLVDHHAHVMALGQLHDVRQRRDVAVHGEHRVGDDQRAPPVRSEEHTSELQSRQYLVCRLLLEKKKTKKKLSTIFI